MTEAKNIHLNMFKYSDSFFNFTSKNQKTANSLIFKNNIKMAVRNF